MQSVRAYEDMIWIVAEKAVYRNEGVFIGAGRIENVGQAENGITDRAGTSIL